LSKTFVFQNPESALSRRSERPSRSRRQTTSRVPLAQVIEQSRELDALVQRAAGGVAEDP